jgi:hypothetical protein
MSAGSTGRWARLRRCALVPQRIDQLPDFVALVFRVLLASSLNRCAYWAAPSPSIMRTDRGWSRCPLANNSVAFLGALIVPDGFERAPLRSSTSSKLKMRVGGFLLGETRTKLGFRGGMANAGMFAAASEELDSPWLVRPFPSTRHRCCELPDRTRAHRERTCP